MAGSNSSLHDFGTEAEASKPPSCMLRQSRDTGFSSSLLTGRHVRLYACISLVYDGGSLLTFAGVSTGV